MRSLYHQTRAAGLDPNFWYAVARSTALTRGSVVEVAFWGQSIALFRSSHGVAAAIANSCVHRKIKLTLGNVAGDRLVCAYHGWEYDATGRVVRIPHDLFSRPMPDLCVKSYPVCERYGLVWLFPGEPSRAAGTSLPPFPEMEGPRAWASVKLDLIWNAHFSIIIENLLDFTHAYLHRRSRAFEDVVLTRSASDAHGVVAEYNAAIGNGHVLGRFVNRRRVDTTRIFTYFDYPYQRASIDDKIKHWCFLTPIGPRKTQLFITIVMDPEALRVPMTSLCLPRRLAQRFLDAARWAMIESLIDEDRRAVEAEQEAIDAVPESRIVELNPVTRLVQEMITRNWSGDGQSHAH